MGRRPIDIPSLQNELQCLDHDLVLLKTTKDMMIHHVTPRRVGYVIEYVEQTMADIRKQIEDLQHGQA